MSYLHFIVVPFCCLLLAAVMEQEHVLQLPDDTGAHQFEEPKEIVGLSASVGKGESHVVLKYQVYPDRGMDFFDITVEQNGSSDVSEVMPARYLGRSLSNIRISF